MVKKTKETQEIIWDLSDLCKSDTDPIIKSTMSTSIKASKKFQEKYRNKIKDLSATELCEAYKEKEVLLTPLYKIAQYVSLRQAIETQNPTLKQLSAKIDDCESEVSNYLVFFELEVGMLSKEKLATFLKNPALKNYAYVLKRSSDTAQYNLSEAEEKMITIKDVTGSSSYQNLYAELTASFSFSFTLDGKKQVLTGPELRNLRQHPKQSVRIRAMKTYFKAYEDNKIVVTHIFNQIIKDFNTERKLRGYKSPIQVRNSGNDLPDKTIEILHDVTAKSHNLVQRYYKLKKKILKLKRMTLADIYAPLPSAQSHFSYKESKDLVLSSFKRFDPEFHAIAEKMFKQNRIHAPVQKGKRGGAFCSGYTPDTYPYVMLNYLGKPRDISTMAHELGHAIHDVLASKQSLVNYHPILPLAETASVFSEMIVTDSLKTLLKTDEDRKVLLCEKLEDIFATSHRQNMFSCFEQATHDSISSTVLSTAEICTIYTKLLKSMFGSSVEIGDEFKWEWAGIPHFLDYPFYVYAYNFGNLLVLALYQIYKEEGDTFIPKLKTMLAAGSNKSPLEITKEIGIDIQKKAFWEKSIVYISSQIDELEALI